MEVLLPIEAACLDTTTDSGTMRKSGPLPSPGPTALSRPAQQRPADSQPTDGYVAASNSEGKLMAVSKVQIGSSQGFEHTDEPASDHAATTRQRSPSTMSKPGVVRRLSATKMQELMANRDSLPVTSLPDRRPTDAPLTAGLVEMKSRPTCWTLQGGVPAPDLVGEFDVLSTRPTVSTRTLSMPPPSQRVATSQLLARGSTARRNSYVPPRPAPLDLDGRRNFARSSKSAATPVGSEQADAVPRPPMDPPVPLPPLSIPTILQLELAAQRPSPLYIDQSLAGDMAYESCAVTFERLKNFLFLPQFLERTILFGALACLDAWLWTFTMLPLRFCIALGVLIQWWGYLMAKETQWLVGYVWSGLGRLWQRGRRGQTASRQKGDGASLGRADESRSRGRKRGLASGRAVDANGAAASFNPPAQPRLDIRHGAARGPKRAQTRASTGAYRHGRTKSAPSRLTSFHKADMLQGLVIICSSMALLKLDASRMYHSVRAQSQIKLYVIFNLLELGDRLLAALGQDVFECLFSAETLSRNSSGRSKIMLPLGMFGLALVYNVCHSVVLFYQVVTLNVAVNSYSHALLSLLMSNQFVEVKSAVFKRFEKENTFQLTCADIVERFQLWVMLFIIGMRNVVEVGGLSVPGAGSEGGGDEPGSTPLQTASNLPASFTMLPSWLWSGEVLSPFLIVVGSEMLVDWVKHAYINKFNNIKLDFYSRILDILCKDYYTNAFVMPSLTRRLGLPLLPLSCLFIRASFQTYRIFLTTYFPTPLPPSSQTSLSVDSAAPSPALRAALDRLDSIIRNALGRAVHGDPYPNRKSALNGTTPAGSGSPSTTSHPFLGWTNNDLVAALAMAVVSLLIFAVLLVVKLVVGMVLLHYARNRYARMRSKEAAGVSESYNDRGSKRVGAYGHVAVGDERMRCLYADDTEGYKKARDKQKRAERNADKEKRDWSGVMRYEMIAKRIW